MQYYCILYNIIILQDSIINYYHSTRYMVRNIPSFKRFKVSLTTFSMMQVDMQHIDDRDF